LSVAVVCVWLNDNADAGADVRLIGEFPSQGTAQYPRQKSQQEINGSNEKIECMVVNESVQMFGFVKITV
jgi:hypothetical protein